MSESKKFDKRLVSAKTAAEYFAVSERTIRHWMQMGKIGYYKKGGNNGPSRIDLNELENLFRYIPPRDQ